MAAWWRRLFGGEPDRRGSQWTTTAALAAALDRADPVLVLDVRGAEERRGRLGAIPGALNMPLDELAQRLGALPRQQPIVVVCKTDKRSARAAAMLRDAGFDAVAVLAGGMERWTAEGRPHRPEPSPDSSS